MPAVAVADTHALVWYSRANPRKLGPAARDILERAAAREAAVYVPVLVLVELADMALKGTLPAPNGFRRWVEDLFGHGNFFAADLTWDIVRRAEELYCIPERGDRLIAATAAHLDLPLITRDPEICAAAGVEVVW